ncbi:rhodanese-like domain-containing protein [Sinomonas gamaensis]|uniref:rhodanese-like domain-containing protein n=1 Tax=Sinomonas gamaensis TaxID=2565624 RepID=UPI001BB13CFA|nr:rhodanese-like domain-containing protein [Sinomonas gamaensis]
MVSRNTLLAFLEAKLAYEIDVVAAHGAQAEGTAVIIDTRKQHSWDHGHIAGALHLPTTALDAPLTLPRDRTLIVYGWGPGCNGATATAYRLLSEGYDVRELVGGYEYWVRNGFAVERAGSVGRRSADPLVTAELD